MRFLLPLFATLLFAGSGMPIGEDISIGNLKILKVASIDEYTVFLQARTCDITTATVRVVFADKEAGERNSITKAASFRDCAGSTVRLTFPTDGRVVSDVRIVEANNSASYSIKP